jgi:CarD family transcriptional regulator
MAVKKTTGRDAAKKGAASKRPVSKPNTKTAAKAAASKAAARKAPVAAKAKAAKKVVQAKTAPAKAAAKPHTVPKGVAPKPNLAAMKTVHPSSAKGKPPTISPPRQAAPAAARTMPAAMAKFASQKITGPIPPIKPALDKVAAAREAANKKPVSQRHGFKTGEWIVYPAHGVGRIVTIEEQEIAGLSLELFVITFEKDKMTLRVPTGKSQSVGMRKLADENIVKRAMDTLKGKARIKRTMWSRRAQEYEAKINSGDLISIAEVVRDLYRSESQPEQSYSERQLYEAALDRMAREIAAVAKLDERGAVQRITDVLSKSAKGRRAAAEEVSEIKAA